jgi:hypothetical protein
MSKRKDPESNRGDLARQVERLAYEALRRSGELFPITPEDVARVEKQLGDVPEPVPRSLLTPPDLSASPALRRLRLVSSPLDAETQKNLARAAREGKAIPPEIEERMRRDREAAERDGKK